MKKYKVDYSRYTFMPEDERGYYINGVYHSGYKNKKGYIVDNIRVGDGISYPFYEHIIKWEYFNGEVPEGMEIDHIIPVKNGGTNKLSNLRLVTPKGNANNELSLINKSQSHKGKKQTEETVMKRSVSMKGKLVNHPNLSKEVDQINPVNGEVVKTWKSTMECERNGFCHTAVRQCCNGTYYNNNIYKQYMWRWKS